MTQQPGPFASVAGVTLYRYTTGEVDTHVPVLHLSATGEGGAQRVAQALVALGLPADTAIRLKPLGGQAWGRQTLAGMVEHGPRKGGSRHPNDPRGPELSDYDEGDA